MGLRWLGPASLNTGLLRRNFECGLIGELKEPVFIVCLSNFFACFVFCFVFCVIVIRVEILFVDEMDGSKQSWLNYFVTVKEVLKKGNSKFRVGREFEFKKRAGCKCPDLKEGKEYLIMGRDQRSLNVLDDKDYAMLWEKRKSNKAELEDLRARISKHPRCKGK